MEAIKIFRPDGLTVTIFGDRSRIWLNYDPEGRVDPGSAPLPAAALEQMKGGRIVELSRASAKAGAASVRVRHVEEGEAETAFREAFGVGFRQKREVPDAPSRAVRDAGPNTSNL